jgi:hypothetical protein
MGLVLLWQAFKVILYIIKQKLNCVMMNTLVYKIFFHINNNKYPYTFL